MSISLQTLMPSAVTPNTQILVTDIDGDGTNEVIMLDSNLKQLSVCHQFQYSDISLSDISSIWSTSTTPIWTDATVRWMTTWGLPLGGIPVSQGATFSPWQVTYGDVIMAGDFDGDGTDELFIYNLEKFTWGLLKWGSSGLQTIANLSVAPGTGGTSVSSPYTPVTWQASAADQYFVVPKLSNIMSLVTANAAGIFCYNSQTYATAMIAFAGGNFSEPWKATSTTLGGWQLNPNHPSPTINKFFPGYFTAAGVPSIAVYSPTTAYMSLLQWDAQNKQFTSSPGQGHQAGDWSYGSLDQYQVADLDGDGMSEIFTYAPNTNDIGMLKFESGSFQSFGITKQQVGTQGNVWQPGGNDQYFCLSGSGNISGPIYAFCPNPLNLAVLCYQKLSTTFTCRWSGTSLPPNNTWKVTASDTFYVGPSWDTATPALITLSNQGASPVFTLGALGWNGQNLSTGSQVQFVSSQTVPVAAFTPSSLAANAPPTPFPQTWPNAAQTAIYAYLSKLFPIPGANNLNPTSDIRSLYTSVGDMGKFQDYADDLNKVQSPSPLPSNWPAPPAGSNWQQSDWQAVLNTIVNECNQVNTAYSMYLDIGSLAADFHIFQVEDLQTVGLNIQQLVQTSPASSANYWIGQIDMAIVWGMIGCLALVGPGAAAAAVFFTIVASLVGSAIAYDPEEQEPLAEDAAAKQITHTFSSSIVGNSLDLTAILTDPVKMNILDGLHDNGWMLNSDLPSTIKEPFQAVDRLAMYQLLMPYYFSITAFGPGTNLPSQGATFSLGNISYCLKGENYFSASQFSQSTLYTDLFTTIGVTKTDFFLGNGPWASIPRKSIS